jgi:hypothetical protein
MTQEQLYAFYKEYITVLTTEPLNLPIWLMLQCKFMSPAMMIANGGEVEKFVGRFSLNGWKTGNICNP